jgi:hypothetical protein
MDADQAGSLAVHVADDDGASSPRNVRAAASHSYLLVDEDAVEARSQGVGEIPAVTTDVSWPRTQKTRAVVMRSVTAATDNVRSTAGDTRSRSTR